jgi:hypothetical protein
MNLTGDLNGLGLGLGSFMLEVDGSLELDLGSQFLGRVGSVFDTDLSFDLRMDRNKFIKYLYE